ATAASSASDRFKIVFRQLAALPVTVTSVTATLKNKDIEVKWNVQNESGIQQYQVEKSTDGIQFNQASSVNAKNSVSGSYSWTDLNVADGTYYYRIKIISVDGKTSYTQIVKVISGKLLDQISIYPNPVKDGVIHLQLTNQPEGNYGVRLFNSIGQIIVSKKIAHAKGTSEETIVCPNLAKGIYQLEVVKSDGSVEVIKVMN
ncbi:MAG: T9SS type A sorting domain-containing protein, partial [Ginsengibacter sp.]